MGLFNNLIAILAIKILFFKVDMWHINATSFTKDQLLELGNQLKVEGKDAIEIFNNSKCSEMISRKISQFVPYTETYRYKLVPEHGITWSSFYRTKNRLNYRRQFHMTWTCCEGYVQSGAMCVPRCPRSCEKGTCKEPDVCTCNQGYNMSSNGSCVPECTNGCVNGTCVDPEVCSCNEGYWMDSDGFTCRPVCDEECERNYGYCSEPNVCTCRTGYRRISNNSSSLFFMCEPICDRECTNGRCAAPNACMCAMGYERDKDEPFICKPKCDKLCVFGTCTAPGTCTCDPGYGVVNASVCEPICSKPCKMGTCMAPETCICNEGYEQSNNFKHICEPICKIKCNGVCIAPGLCLHKNPTSCNKGYVYDETTYTCKPHCTIPCGPNGECTSPNKCTCFEGYQSEGYITQMLKRYAQPIFPKNILPWEPMCQPVCDFNCINGKCTAPNVCTCDPDYYPSWKEFHQPLNNETRFCVRPKLPCINKRFFACEPNATCKFGVCICDDGYAKDTNDICIPFCTQKCSNGTCTAPNRCECDNGFALGNDSLCEPICERGCQNGDCIGPNRCVCHDNFIPNVDHHSKPECIPVCTRNCSGHGECVIDRDRDHDYRCECHFGWTGWNCNQPTVCVITMTYTHDDVNRITIRNDTNSTIMRAYQNAPFCYQCDDSFDKETLCHVMLSDEGNYIGCLLSTDLPCYTTYNYNVSIDNTIIIWPVILAILLITSLTVIAYAIYRKRQKEKLATAVTSPNVFVRESFATEFLLPDI